MKSSGIFTLRKIILALAIIVLDMAVYILLGLLLMNYDDFYDESKGPYWSLESMTFWQKVNLIGLNIWHFLNALFIIYILYVLIKRFVLTNKK